MVGCEPLACFKAAPVCQGLFGEKVPAVDALGQLRVL